MVLKHFVFLIRKSIPTNSFGILYQIFKRNC